MIDESKIEKSELGKEQKEMFVKKQIEIVNKKAEKFSKWEELNRKRFKERSEIKTESPKEKSKYNFEEIAEIEPPMFNVVRQLKKKIETDYYDAIIGDDASGRIPTLIVDKIISKYVEKRNQEKPKDPISKPPCYFMHMGRKSRAYEEKIDFFKSHDLIDKNILIITESIITGDSMSNTLKFLEKNDVSNHINIATLFDVDDSDPGHHFDLMDFGTGMDYETGVEDIIFGGGYGQPLYERYDIAGVAMHRGSSMHVKRYKGANSQDNINEAREDVETMAQKIFKGTWPKNRFTRLLNLSPKGIRKGKSKL